MHRFLKACFALVIVFGILALIKSVFLIQRRKVQRKIGPQLKADIVSSALRARQGLTDEGNSKSLFPKSFHPNFVAKSKMCLVACYASESNFK